MGARDHTGLVVFSSRKGDRVYTNPVDIVQAYSLDEIIPCLTALEQAVEGGLHAAGYLAYEAAPAFDSALPAHPLPEWPLLWFGLYPRLAEAAPESSGWYGVGAWRPKITESAYIQAVNRIREYIAAGDTYQVNYTFPLETLFEGDAFAWYRRLVEAQGADHCAYIDTGRFKVLSASPELFFDLQGTRLETRPMKGTRRRGRWSEEDRRVAEDLARSEKDRAENVMIVDLLRNDMGRISDIGSVSPTRLFQTERYETVWQMTSTIQSRTHASVPQILGALFPSGSVTGAPKPHTMSIIRDLEPYPRGVYCGAIGWWAPERRAAFNVAIRTVTVDGDRDRAECHVGGAITWGSRAAVEFDECRAKTAFLTFQRPDFDLLESMRFDGDYFLLGEHMARLEASADYFGFALDLDAIRTALEYRAFKMRAAYGADLKEQPRKVRLLLQRSGEFELTDEWAKPATAVRVAFAAEPVDRHDVFLFHKTTYRTVYEHARASQPDHDDVLLWNRDDLVTESTTANLVLRLGGRLLTPRLDAGLLPGTFRAYLLEDGILEEAELTKDDVFRAEAIHLINSVRGWIPVTLEEHVSG